MRDGEFLSVGEVADYLRVSPEKVLRLVENEGLPMVSASEGPRFQLAAIEQWLRSRIARLPELERAVPGFDAFLSSDRVAVLVDADKSSLIAMMANSIIGSGMITDKEKLMLDLIHRERLMSTGIGLGVAIPHVRTPAARDLVVAAAVVENGVRDYESLDDVPIRLAFMIVGREDQHEQHLRLLSGISRRLKNQDYMRSLIAAGDGRSLYALLTGKEGWK